MKSTRLTTPLPQTMVKMAKSGKIGSKSGNPEVSGSPKRPNPEFRKGAAGGLIWGGLTAHIRLPQNSARKYRIWGGTYWPYWYKWAPLIACLMDHNPPYFTPLWNRWRPICCTKWALFHVQMAHMWHPNFFFSPPNLHDFLHWISIDVNLP